MLMVADCTMDGLFSGKKPWAQFITIFLMHVNRHRRADEILKWLIKTNLTGENLFEWIKIEMRGSILGTMKFVVMQIDKDSEIRPIIAGRDYLG